MLQEKAQRLQIPDGIMLRLQVSKVLKWEAPPSGWKRPGFSES